MYMPMDPEITRVATASTCPKIDKGSTASYIPWRTMDTAYTV